MQSITNTPAECLLQRLLHSQKIDSNYSVTVERKETHTSIFINIANCHEASRISGRG